MLKAYRGFDLDEAVWFESGNRSSLQEFRARSKADARALKREMDRLRGQLQEAAA